MNMRDPLHLDGLVGKVDICLHFVIDSTPIHHTNNAFCDSGEEKLPFEKKKTPAEHGSVCEAFCWGHFGV